MQDQIWLTLHWPSYWGGSSDIITSNFAHKGGQYVDYELMLLHSPLTIQDARKKSLTIHWRSFLGSGSHIVSSIFAHIGGQYFHFGLYLLHSPVMAQDARPEIVDAPFMLISRMGQCVCHFLFYLQRQWILPLWKDVTMQPFDCRKRKTKNRWRSVVAHLKDILKVIGCSTIVCKIDQVIIGSQYMVSLYIHLHPKASWLVNFWSNTIISIWAMNEGSPSWFSAFGRQLLHIDPPTSFWYI